MAEYWKSQPKKFCDFCKCWIADNKASVDFHEKGKKHQENVKLRIQEVKKKGTERRQQQEQLHDDLAAIEAAALKAYKKDIGYLNSSKETSLRSETIPEQEHKTKEKSAETTGTSSSGNDNWTTYQTPDGYWYYYNSVTGESRWDLPEGFSFPNEQNQRTFGYSEQSSRGQSNELVKSDEICEQNMERNNEHKSPFGKWETVAVYDRNEDLEPKQEAREKGENIQVPAAKFKEKQLPVRKKNDLNETNITFKKRKSNQEKKRSIRQRSDDL